MFCFRQICQLLKRGADKSAVNSKGETPLDIAVEGKHADIVTLFVYYSFNLRTYALNDVSLRFRVHTMRDEFNEEFDNPMNQTVDDVILDITRRAAKAATASSEDRRSAADADVLNLDASASTCHSTSDSSNV